MGLRFVMLDGAARSLVERLVQASDAAPEVPTAPGYAPPAVEFEHGSVRVRLTAATASFFTYNPLLHVGMGGCFLPAETDVPLGTGYQLDILDGGDRLIVRCKAKVAAKQDRWIGLRFLDIERSRAAGAARRDRQALGPRAGSLLDAGRASRTRRSGRWRHGRARRSARGRHPAVAASARGPARRPRSAVRRRPRAAAPTIPAWVVVGLKPGPRVSVVGAQRGHETTAALAAARLAAGLDPAALMGSVVIVPVLRPGGQAVAHGSAGARLALPGRRRRQAGGARRVRAVLGRRRRCERADRARRSAPRTAGHGRRAGPPDQSRVRRLARGSGAAVMLAASKSGGLLAAAAAARIPGVELSAAGDTGAADSLARAARR